MVNVYILNRFERHHDYKEIESIKKFFPITNPFIHYLIDIERWMSLHRKIPSKFAVIITNGKKDIKPPEFSVCAFLHFVRVLFSSVLPSVF